MSCEKEFSTENCTKVVEAYDHSYTMITLEKRGEELTVYCDGHTVTFNSIWLNFSINWQIICHYVDQFHKCQTYHPNHGFYNNGGQNITLCHNGLRLYMPFGQGMDLLEILSNTKTQLQLKDCIE
jgi:hypothetical protein